jgi:Na+/melibiose symporter-like transporter
MGNLSFALFPFVEMKHNGDQSGFIYSIIIYVIVSIIVVLIWGPRKLSRKLDEKKSQ